jgi:hypothetical protein
VDCEPLLGKGDDFKAVSGDWLEKCDRCNLNLDENISENVGPGQTAAEFENRHKNEKSPKLQDGATKIRGFYQSYLHPIGCNSVDGDLGLWSDLEQVLGIGVAWHQRQSVKDLFDRTESEKQCLSKLEHAPKVDFHWSPISTIIFTACLKHVLLWLFVRK